MEQAANYFVAIKYRAWTLVFFFFFSSRRRHTRSLCDWSSDVCSSDLQPGPVRAGGEKGLEQVAPILRGNARPGVGHPQLHLPLPRAVARVAAQGPAGGHGPEGVGQEIGRASCRERG